MISNGLVCSSYTGLGVTDVLYKFDFNDTFAYFNKINRINWEAIQFYN